MPVFCHNPAEAATRLRGGQLVAFPTETVYGLGADATNPLAVARIFEAKQRPAFDPLIVHIASPDQLGTIVTSCAPIARQLAAAFWPGPLTLVLPRKPCIPDIVTSGLPGVGVRIPAHALALEMLRLAGCPVAAPSANPFGRISPTTAQHVFDGLGDQVDCILDGGPCLVGVESTVISLMDQHPVLLRHGGCPLEQIERTIGRIEVAQPVPGADHSAQPAPGMLTRHYAPGTRLLLVPHHETARPLPGLRCGLLSEGSRRWESGFDRIELLCDTCDLRSCAAGFFAALRTLDSAELDVIIAHQFPDRDLGLALNDRLIRAAAGSSDQEVAWS